MSQYVWHVKGLSLLSAHEFRVHVRICSPSPVTVTSRNERKNLDWDEQFQTNKPYINPGWFQFMICH